MARPSLRDNPNADPGAPEPSIHLVPVAGSTLYAEERGEGPTILIVPGGGEDAEGWRPVAERLSGFRVVTYDRRGTLRSGREDWPGRGSTQHADDAAALLEVLGASDAVVFGGSSAGVITVALAVRHPQRVRMALVFEPGYLGIVPEGARMQAHARASVEAYLRAHPADWLGAYGAFARALPPGSSGDGRGFLEPPPDKVWYGRREELNAEALIRDDIELITTETLDEGALRLCPVDLRFSYGTGSLPLFAAIATHLAAVRGATPDVIPGVGHALTYHPDEAAAYIAHRARA